MTALEINNCVNMFWMMVQVIIFTKLLRVVNVYKGCKLAGNFVTS